MAALDRDFEDSVRGRDERRRQLLRIILGRIAEKYGKPTQESFEETVDIFYALTSFATFDTLAGDEGTVEEIAHVVKRLAGVVLGMDLYL
jgi:hypothetical protein